MSDRGRPVGAMLFLSLALLGPQVAVAELLHLSIVSKSGDTSSPKTAQDADDTGLALGETWIPSPDVPLNDAEVEVGDSLLTLAATEFCRAIPMERPDACKPNLNETVPQVSHQESIVIWARFSKSVRDDSIQQATQALATFYNL